jgi:sugar O-acyltransferase (sialic acid O-acetyltransferase NeuD family)
MSSRIIPLYIENRTVNDDVYVIQNVGYPNGAAVCGGEVLATYETSKSIVDVFAPESGYVFYNNIRVGQEVGVGFILAVVTDTTNFDYTYFTFKEYLSDSNGAAEMPVEQSPDIRVTKAARNLMIKHGLGLDDFNGKKCIRSRDVDEIVRLLSSGTRATPLSSQGGNNKLLVIGSSGHAKVCLEILRQANDYEIVGIVDSALIKGDYSHGLPILGGEADLLELFESGINFAVIGFSALHKTAVRQNLYDKLIGLGYRLPNVIHKSAVIEPSSVFGNGNQVMAGAIIGSDVSIGNNCILNSGCIISHDCNIQDNVHVAPGAVLAGSVSVGSNTLVGMGVTVYMKLSIGSNCIIYNGKNVFDNLSDNTILKV